MTRSRRHILLAGCSGAGKSTVGRLLAQRRGEPFIDLDERIAHDAKSTIADLIENDGEDRFRVLEAQAFERVLDEPASIIALGGGALQTPSIFEACGQQRLVWLHASADTCERRTGADLQRPLRHAIGERWAERVQTFRRLRLGVTSDVDDPSATALAVQLVLDIDQTVADLHVLPVMSPDGPYCVWLGSGILPHAPDILSSIGLANRPVALLHGQGVPNRHATPLVERLSKTSSVLSVPDGEIHKTPHTLITVLQQLAWARMARDGVMMGLGGGTLCDMAGLAAAVYMRGLPFVAMPTTLLAMVDASVGGKNAIDLPEGKNLVGTFKHPAAVLADLSTLETLSADEIRAGMGEVIKHGLLSGGRMLKELESESEPTTAHLVAQALAVKIDIVERDPGEVGPRMFLNLGHTFAHAFEKVSDFAMPHGLAVGVGLVAAAELGRLIGACDASLVERNRGIAAGPRPAQPDPTRRP